MNSFERILATVNFENADRLPVIAQVFGHTAAIAGRTIRDYVTSGSELADCQIKALERYGYDAIFAVMDVNIETEALGSRLVYRSHDYPYVRDHAIPASFFREFEIPRLKKIFKAFGAAGASAGNCMVEASGLRASLEKVPHS